MALCMPCHVRTQQMNTSLVGEDDAKVKVIAAPINPADINTIQG